MSKPLVSVCIPTYRGEKYIKECLNSIIVQSFTDFEVLIVDDCSTDSTFDIAREYAKQDSRIQLFQNEKNLGLVCNWNRCVELAQGEWIKFVFQDDLITPNCLEKMVASVKPGNMIIFCRRNFLFDDLTSESTKQLYTSNVKLIDDCFSRKNEISPQDYREIAFGRIGWNLLGEPTSVMLNRNIFYRFGVFNSHLIHICDLEFWTRVAIHTGITYVPETLATFRVHKSAATAKNRSFREYRTDILDHLILWHDVLFHPAYLPLRAMAAKQTPSVNLLTIFRSRARQAWLTATHEPDSPLLIAEWSQVVEAYPILKLITKQTFLERITEPIFSKLALSSRLKSLKALLNKKFQTLYQR